MLWNVDFPVSAPPKAPVQSQAGGLWFFLVCFFFCRALWVGLPKCKALPDRACRLKNASGLAAPLLSLRTQESQLRLKQLGIFVPPPGRTKLTGKMQLWLEAEPVWKTWPSSLASSREAFLHTVSLILKYSIGQALWYETATAPLTKYFLRLRKEDLRFCRSPVVLLLSALSRGCSEAVFLSNFFSG